MEVGAAAAAVAAVGAAASSCWGRERADPSLEEGEAQREEEEQRRRGLGRREQQGEGAGVGAREHQDGKEEGEEGEDHRCPCLERRREGAWEGEEAPWSRRRRGGREGRACQQEDGGDP